MLDGQVKVYDFFVCIEILYVACRNVKRLEEGIDTVSYDWLDMRRRQKIPLFKKIKVSIKFTVNLGIQGCKNLRCVAKK